MDDEQSLATGPDSAPPPGSAAEAFSDLAARVAAMEDKLDRRMAVMARTLEHIAAEKQAIDIPDYGNTLAKIAKSLVAIEGKPALQMTPEDMAARMEAAAAQARRYDRATLAEARQLQADALKNLTVLVRATYTIREQRHRLWWSGGICLILGCLVWAVIPGFVAHLVPREWHWPERIAARAVRAATPWDAGMYLMRADDPAAWETLVKATEIWRENHDVIAECKRLAKPGRTTRCIVQIKG